MTLENQKGHYSEVSKPNRCIPLKFVGAVIAVGRVSNLMSRDLQVLFPGRAFFHQLSISLTIER